MYTICPATLEICECEIVKTYDFGFYTDYLILN